MSSQTSDELERTIAALEAGRRALGDAATDAAIAALRRGASEAPGPPAPPVGEEDEERKLVTVMFADASGFTALSEQNDAETVRALMNGCFATLVPVIERHGGTIDKFIGDCVMALFGAPVAREDDAQRALAAALDMMEALAGFNRANGTALGLHFGVNTGEVIAGGVGGRGRRDYSVIGDAVNVAARLQDLAKTGEIFVGPETVRQGRAKFVFEEVSTVQLKGRSRPVQVHRLLGRRADGERQAEAPAAGRDNELAVIADALREGVAGPMPTVLVAGEAGIGKTRLIAEACRSAGDAAHFVFARAQATSSATPYGLFAEALMRLTDSRIELGSTAFAANLARRCQDLGETADDELLPALALLAGLPLEPAATRHLQSLAPELLQWHFAQAFTRLARGGRPATPLVQCFEDLHWADSASVALIGRLGEIDEPPALTIVSARSDSLPELETAGLKGDTTIRLEGLAPEEIRRLAAGYLGVQTIGSHLFALLERRGEGNPFFLDQILAKLSEAEGIDTGGGVAELRPDAADVSMPATLQGLILSRLDQLPKPSKRTLQSAAVVGRTFPVRLVERLGELDGASREQTGEQLDHLTARDFLRRNLAEASKLAEDQLAFCHASIQEVAYGTLLTARRQAIHRAIAETLEAFFGENSQELTLTLGFHLRSAGEDLRAARYFLDGAEKAAEIYAWREARNAYRDALDALDRGDPELEEPGTRRRRIRALAGLGELLARNGEHGPAETAFREALDLCGPAHDIDAAGLHRRIGLSRISQRQTAEAAHSFETALWLLGSPNAGCTPQWWFEWIEVQLERLWAAYFSGDLASMQRVRDESRERIQRQGNLSQRSRFAKRVLLIAFREECLNISDATMAAARDSLAISQDLDDPDDLARAHFMVAFCSMWRGDFATAQEHYPLALELATRTGNAEYRVMTAAYTTVMHRKRGDVALVEEWCSGAEALAKEAEMPLYVSIARANRAWLALRNGALDEVETLTAPIVAAWAKSPWQLTWLAAWPLLAARLEAGPDADIGLPLAAMVRPNQQRQGQAIGEALARAYQLLGSSRPNEASAALREASALARDQGFI
jgi:class 3 adenylate cyclase